MDIQEIGYRALDWIDLAQDRDNSRAIVNSVMKLLVRKSWGGGIS
jgi:hypothetical protein